MPGVHDFLEDSGVGFGLLPIVCIIAGLAAYIWTCSCLTYPVVTPEFIDLFVRHAYYPKRRPVRIL